MTKILIEISKKAKKPVMSAYHHILIEFIDLSGSIDGITISDMTQPDYPLVYVSPGFEKITGYASQEVLGRNCRFLQGTDRDQPALEMIGQAIKAEEECRVVLRNYHKNGSLFWNELTIYPRHDSSGQLTHFVGVQRDISERRQAEEALRESEERFRHIFENGPLGMCLIGLDYRFLKVNAAFCWMVEYKPEELQGRSFIELTHPEDVETELEVTRLLFNENLKSSQMENRYITKSGKVIWLNLTSAIINDREGHPLYALTMSEEVTERKQNKANLEQERALLAKRVEERTAKLTLANVELARAARQKDQFLANMSHELRTPLNAILGLADALQEQMQHQLNSEQQEYLQGITDSGRDLLALINDILDMAKIEAGKVRLNIGLVIVEDLCLASLKSLKPTAIIKKMRISSYFDHTISTILADERRLKQILTNLLSNAVKFTAEQGTIGLEVCKDDEKQMINFTVWDTGIGIAEEDLPHLFQPFMQVDSALSRQYNGSGLGLALVRRLTELHGGSVSVESQVGKGSRFTVSLPL